MVCSCSLAGTRNCLSCTNYTNDISYKKYEQEKIIEKYENGKLVERIIERYPLNYGNLFTKTPRDVVI
jgi:hypothetical protein